MSWLNWKCGDSKIKIVLKSNCFKYRKLVFNLNNRNEDDLDKIFKEIKEVINRHNSNN